MAIATVSSVGLVALGGAAGAVSRYAVTSAAGRLFGHGFPAGTIFVNVVGSFAMGLLIGWIAARTQPGNAALRLVLATGFLGGFTTFSAFSLDVAVLFERGQLSAAAVYVVSSFMLSIVAVFAGLAVMRSMG